MVKQFGTTNEELVAQLNATEPMEHFDFAPGSPRDVKSFCIFVPKLLQPEEVREKAREYLEMIVSSPDSSTPKKERKELARLIGYRGKIEVDNYVRNEVIKARLKEVAEILLYASLAAGVIAGGGYIGKLLAHANYSAKEGRR